MKGTERTRTKARRVGKNQRGPTKQLATDDRATSTEHSATAPQLVQNRDQADTMKIRPISGTNRATRYTSHNNNISYSLAARLDSRKKIKMPTTVQILPQPSTGKKPFKFNVNFDTSRTKSILSEDIETHFGLMDVLTYPGPVALLDANGQLLNFCGRSDIQGHHRGKNYKHQHVGHQRNSKGTINTRLGSIGGLRPPTVRCPRHLEP